MKIKKILICLLLLVNLSKWTILEASDGPPPIIGSTVVCVNYPITYTSSVTCPEDEYVYFQSWYLTDSNGNEATYQIMVCNSTGAGSFTYTFTTPGNYTLFYSVAICDENWDCQALTNYDQITITVVGNDQYLCGNFVSPFSLTASANIYAGNYCSSPGTTDIQSGVSGTVIAGSAILINPGFTAESGSEFSATISPQPCSTQRTGALNEENRPAPTDAARENSILVSPNPSNGVFRVHGIEPGTQKAHIILYNSSGNKILENDLLPLSGEGAKIDLSAEPEGVYLLEVITEEKTYIKRMIKE